MLGSHLSIAGGMVRALDEAARLKMECVQVFTKNQRQWRVPPLRDEERDVWLARLGELGWDFTSGRREARGRVVSHNSYLVNMASPDEAAWSRSVALQRAELERCEALHIPFCVAHPGAHLGAPRPRGEANRLDGRPSEDERAGLGRIVAALDRLHRDLPGYRAVTCLETTVGSGTNLGYDFAHLRWIRDRVREPERVGYCFDTCHVTAAGYDMTTETRARAVLRRFGRVCGIRNLKVFHLNDSAGAVGSRTDRHAHIGDGACGRACFAAIMNRSSLARVPMILETPKEATPAGTPMDVVNMRRLRRLVRRGAGASRYR